MGVIYSRVDNGVRINSGDTVDVNQAIRADVFTFGANTSYTVRVDGQNRASMTTDQNGNAGALFTMGTPNGSHTVDVKDTATGFVTPDSVIQLTTTGFGGGGGSMFSSKMLLVLGLLAAGVYLLGGKKYRR